MMNFSPSRLTLLLTAAAMLLLGCALLGAGCAGDDEDEAGEDAPRQQQSLSAPEKGQSAVDTTAGAAPQASQTGSKQSEEDSTQDPSAGSRLVTLTEPKEKAFTVKMPDGWKNEVALVQVYDQKRSVVTATKPGGNTFMFLGDPQMPAFSEPNPQFDSGPLANSNPLLKPARFTPAKEFFTAYLKKKFGKLPDFRIVGTAPNPRLESIVRASAKKLGLTGEITTVLIAFDYRDNGKLIHSLINGMTLKNGAVWVADLNGVSSADDPTQYNDLLLDMAESYKSNPEWQAKQRQLSEAWS